jgi:GAF domain-containing protein
MPITSFTVPETPANEAERLTALKDYCVLDTPPEPEFDAIVAEAANVFEVPTALISLIDRDRQWFKAKIGLDPPETPRAPSFCGHAIHADDVFIVPDTAADERFAGNPLVIGGPQIRFYAGAPLITPRGQRIGTLCLIDQKPRPALTDSEVATLRAMAAKVITLLEARRSPPRGA